VWYRVRRSLPLLVAAAVLLLFPAFASAKVPQPGDPEVMVARFWVGKAYYELDGVRHDMDVAPYVKNGRTLLPLRYAGYALGLDPRDVEWDPEKKQAKLKRCYVGKTKYDYVAFTQDSKKFTVNGWPYGKLDVPAEIVPPGRFMLPMRAAVHALGGLCFWDGKDQSVTVVTWRVAPEPVKLSVKRVEVPEGSLTAKVTYTDGRTEEVRLDRPVAINLPENNDGFMIEAIGYWKLWNIPESAMLFDPVRGGIIVRGGAGGFINCEMTYQAYYAGDKGRWGCFYDRWPSEDSPLSDPMYVKDGGFWGDNAVNWAPVKLWGVEMSRDGYHDDLIGGEVKL